MRKIVSHYVRDIKCTELVQAYRQGQLLVKYSEEVFMGLAKRVVILLALSLVVGGASVVLAASAEPGMAARQDAAVRPNDDSAPTPTEVPTSTQPIHPVGAAIAQALDIPYADVMALHESGVGFGVIARAYMTARFSGDQLTGEEVLALFQSGVGWGQIMQEYGVHPGGKGLGAIMRGRPKGVEPPTVGSGSPGSPSCQGNSCKAPRQKSGGRGPKK